MKTEDQIKSEVRQQYGSIVLEAGKKENAGCCSSDCCGGDQEVSFADDYSKLEGYMPDADLKLGCGVPTEFARIKEGDTVLDLGAGAGNDAFIVRRITGETGYVIGVDMTPEMVFKARENKQKMNYSNVDFRLGEIENMPVESESVDVVVSNCVLNLVPNKDKAFSETKRVLKSGGHFSISDIVIEGGEIPDELRDDIAAYAACISGAIGKNEYLEKLQASGFVNVSVQKERELEIPVEFIEKHFGQNWTSVASDRLPKLLSITVYGEKP